MESHGFFSSRVRYHVDTTSRRKRAIITYRTEQGPPSRYGKINYEFNDKFIEKIILQDTASTLIRPGGIFNSATLDAERERITRYLRDRGYYNFSVNNISYRYPYDTVGSRVGDLTMVVKQYLTGYNDRGEPVMENNKVYRISEINMLPGYDPTVSFTDREVRYDTVAYRGLNVVYDGKHNVRPRVLRQAIPLYPNYLYNAEQINRTYNNIMSLGYFKSTRITFDELPAPDSTNLVSYIGNADDSLATQYTQEGYLRCNILGTPQLKQSYKIDLEGTTTSSFYGLKASVGYQNRNLFRGMESFDIAFSIGHEFMKSRDSGKRNAKEFGVTAGLAFPRFLLPFFSSRYRPSLVTPRTRLELSFNYQDRPYYRRTLTSMTWTYSWSNEKYSSFAVRPVDLNLVDMSYINQDFFEKLQNLYLRNSYTSQLVAGISGSYTYNNQLKNPGRNATLVRFNWETAGNLIGGLEHLFSSPAKGKDYYEIFGIQYSQYFRVDLSASRKIMLGEKAAIAGRLYAGCGLAYGNSTSIPFDRLFYCGGSNGMRGWIPRMLGPGSVPVDPRQGDLSGPVGRHETRKRTSNSASRSGESSTAPPSSTWETSGSWETAPRSIRPKRSSTSATSTNSWDSTPASASGSTSSSPCCAWTGVFSCTIPTIRPASGGSTTSSGATRRSTSAWDIRSDEAVDRRQTPPICISTEICLLLQ